MKILLINLFYSLFGFFLRRRYFKKADRHAIEEAIRQAETKHGGEIVIVIETARPLGDVLKRISVRRRAENFFASQRVWDTQENCGILIYLLLSERKIELIADRGIAAKVPHDTWQQLLSNIQPLLQNHQGSLAIQQIIQQLNDLLQQYFPGTPNDPNELSNRPVIV